MNIYAEEGSRVVYTGIGGYDSCKKKGNSLLVVGQTYEVLYTNVGGWHTDVFLKEFPNIGFNSVLFEDYKNQGE